MIIDLIRWARKCKREGTMNEIIDPYLMGKIAPECFMVYADIATSCLRNRAERRPTMGEVLVRLERALELQESADAATGDSNYCIDEYTCNDSSRDASPNYIKVGETASGSTTSAEELSLEAAMPNGQIWLTTNNSEFLETYCFSEVSVELSWNTRLLRSMKSDLDYVFQKLRSMKSRILATYLVAFTDDSTGVVVDRRSDLEIPQ